MPSDRLAGKQLSSEHLLLGSLILELISDWNAWVSRRVDRFYFVGDDERQLHRHQSLDFNVPERLRKLDMPLIKELGGFPVPVTFVSKWRLPQFSLRDERDNSVSLVQREQSIQLSAAMLIALGTLVKTGKLDSLRTTPPKMPESLQRHLGDIPGSEPTDGIVRCVDLDKPLEQAESARAGSWRRTLVCDETMMSLAFELAGGFLVMATVAADDLPSRRLLKFSYNTYVSAARRDPFPAYISHLGRRIRGFGRDGVDPVEWAQSSRWRRFGATTPTPSKTGRLIFSTVCEEAPAGLNQSASSVAAALAMIKGPRERRGSTWQRRRRRQTVRLRPSGVIVLDGLSPGEYEVKIKPQSGYAANYTELKFAITAGEITRLSVRTRRVKLNHRITRAASTLSSPAPSGKAIARGLGWRSKPLAIRVRAGDGGSYHCEFEAPPGLHITRARLISNLEGNADGAVDDPRADGAERSHDLDLVLKSTQRGHLYGPAARIEPATAYALLNLRPRRETIVRPALIAAFAASAVLVFVAFVAQSIESKGQEHELPWTFFALLLAGPGALAAYIAQTVASRVTNAMLWGLRLLALLPTIMSLAAAGALFLDKNLNWPHFWLWLLCGTTALATAMLWFTYWVVEHSPEQNLSDYRQGRHFERRYAARPFGQTPGPDGSAPESGYRPAAAADPAAAIRDRMLERLGGMTHATRRAALGERSLKWWEIEVPPALYFDSGESPAVFRGLPRKQMRALRQGVRRLVEDLADEWDSASRTG